jgi:hypothetical protein
VTAATAGEMGAGDSLLPERRGSPPLRVRGYAGEGRLPAAAGFMTIDRIVIPALVSAAAWLSNSRVR